MKKIALLSLILLCMAEVGIKAQPGGGLQNGANHAGTEFYFSFPPCYEEESAGGDNSLRVYIASDVVQNVTVEVPGKAFSLTKSVPANETIEFRIPTTVGQPFLKGGRSLAPPEKVYTGAAVHVVAEAPVICYGATRYQYTSDAFLALPVARLGKEYIVAAWPQYTAMGAGYQLASLTTISACYDRTKVTFTMGGNNVSQTTGGMKPGQSKTFDMNAGDVLCFSGSGDLQDLSGSYISATKPVAVVSGNQCANVPAGVPWCDYTSDMELPMRSWGNEYHVTPIAMRLQMPVIRVYAKEKNTKIYKNGREWRTIKRDSLTQNHGFIEQRLPVGDDGKPKPCTLTSESGKPIWIMIYNTGQGDDNVPSDPFQMGALPIEQYAKEIVFSTPNAKEMTLPFTYNYIDLFYPMKDTLKMPDDLEVGTISNGQWVWTKVVEKFGKQFDNRSRDTIGMTRDTIGMKLDSLLHGRRYTCRRIFLEDVGIYRFRYSEPIGGYIYGKSSYDSYGYPASGNYRNLSISDSGKPYVKVFTIPVAPLQKSYGIQGTAEDMPADSNKRSNLAMVYADKRNTENCVLQVGLTEQLIAGESSSTDWKLTVTDTSMPAKAVIVFCDRNGNDTSITYTYTPGATSADDYPAGTTTLQATLYPNPATEQVRLTITSQTGANASVKVISSVGATVYSLDNVLLPAGSNAVTISTEILPSGTYRVIVISGAAKVTMPLIVVR